MSKFVRSLIVVLVVSFTFSPAFAEDLDPVQKFVLWFMAEEGNAPFQAEKPMEVIKEMIGDSGQDEAQDVEQIEKMFEVYEGAGCTFGDMSITRENRRDNTISFEVFCGDFEPKERLYLSTETIWAYVFHPEINDGLDSKGYWYSSSQGVMAEDASGSRLIFNFNTVKWVKYGA